MTLSGARCVLTVTAFILVSNCVSVDMLLLPLLLRIVWRFLGQQSHSCGAIPALLWLYGQKQLIVIGCSLCPGSVLLLVAVLGPSVGPRPWSLYLLLLRFPGCCAPLLISAPESPGSPWVGAADSKVDGGKFLCLLHCGYQGSSNCLD